MLERKRMSRQGGFSHKKQFSAMDALAAGDENSGVLYTLRNTLWRLLTTPYTPGPTLRTFESRA
jgi:hypothetical protein